MTAVQNCSLIVASCPPSPADRPAAQTSTTSICDMTCSLLKPVPLIAPARTAQQHRCRNPDTRVIDFRDHLVFMPHNRVKRTQIVANTTNEHLCASTVARIGSIRFRRPMRLITRAAAAAPRMPLLGMSFGPCSRRCTRLPSSWHFELRVLLNEPSVCATRNIKVCATCLASRRARPAENNHIDRYSTLPSGQCILNLNEA